MSTVRHALLFGGQNTTVSPPTGTFSVTGKAPTVSVSVSVLTGTLTVTGLAPSVVIGDQVAPPTATISVSGLAPAVSVSSSVAADVARITFQGFAPTLGAPAVPTPEFGTLPRRIVLRRDVRVGVTLARISVGGLQAGVIVVNPTPTERQKRELLALV